MDQPPAPADPRPDAAAVAPCAPCAPEGRRIGDGEGVRVLFDAVLYPHRSLGRTGFWLILAIVAAVGITIGGFFVLQGAWPIFGFYGLDLLLVWWALRSSYRAGRRYEKVRLTDRELVIERVDPRGRREVLSLQPHWLDVAMDDPPEHESQVTLSSHGRSVVVGSFLSPPERLDFARALRRALERLREPPHLADAPA